MRDAYVTEDDESNEDKTTISEKESNEMGYHSVYRLIGDLNSLNEKSEQLIYEIEHMSVEEEKLDNINNEDVHYDREDNNLRRTNRDNYITGLEQSQPSMEGNSYKSAIKSYNVS